MFACRAQPKCRLLADRLDRLAQVERTPGSKVVRLSNLTIINYVLYVTGPLHEQTLCTILLSIQVHEAPPDDTPDLHVVPHVVSVLSADGRMGTTRKCRRPAHESLCLLMLSPRPHRPPQVGCSAFALLVRYQLAGLLYDVVE